MADHRKIHPYIPKLVEQLEARRIDRRDFLRTATLLGLSATTAYGIVGRVFGESAIPRAYAQAKPKTGGTFKVGMQVQKMEDPATYSWTQMSNQSRHIGRVSGDHRSRQHHAADARPELGSLRRPQDLDPEVAPGRGLAQRRPVRGRARGLELQALARPGPRLVQQRAVDLLVDGRGQGRQEDHAAGRGRGGGRPHDPPAPDQAGAVGAGGLLQLSDRDPAPVVQGAVLRQPDRHRTVHADRARGRRQVPAQADHQDHQRQGLQVLGRRGLSRRDPLLSTTMPTTS